MATSKAVSSSVDEDNSTINYKETPLYLQQLAVSLEFGSFLLIKKGDSPNTTSSSVVVSLSNRADNDRFVGKVYPPVDKTALRYKEAKVYNDGFVGGLRELQESDDFLEFSREDVLDLAFVLPPKYIEDNALALHGVSNCYFI